MRGFAAALAAAAQVPDGTYAVFVEYADGVIDLREPTHRDRAFRQQAATAVDHGRALVVARFGNRRVVYLGRDHLAAVVG